MWPSPFRGGGEGAAPPARTVQIRTIRRTGRATCSSGAPTCSGSSGKGHEYFLKHLLGTQHGVLGKDLGEMGGEKPDGGRLARRGAGRKARPAGHARLPHVDHLRLLRHRAADRDLVREERPQHLRHASRSSIRCRRRWIRCGRRAATGRSTRASPRRSPRSRPRCSASRRTSC